MLKLLVLLFIINLYHRNNVFNKYIEILITLSDGIYIYVIGSRHQVPITHFSVPASADQISGNRFFSDHNW